MLEITQFDLQFTEKEAERFFRKMTDKVLTSEDIALLTLKIEGWIAGLQLAALSLQPKNQEDVEKFMVMVSTKW